MVNIPSWWLTLHQHPTMTLHRSKYQPNLESHILQTGLQYLSFQREVHIFKVIDLKKPQPKSRGWFSLVDKMCEIRKMWKQQEQTPHRLEFTHQHLLTDYAGFLLRPANIPN
jgi:hypothetical protein